MNTVEVTVFNALGSSRAARQVTQRVDVDSRFSLVGACENCAQLESEIASFANKPRLILVSTTLGGEPVAKVVQRLVRLSGRVVVLGLGDLAPAPLQQALDAGALHAQSFPIRVNGELEERHLERILHLLALLGEVGGLDSLPAHVMPVVEKRPWGTPPSPDVSTHEPAFVSDPSRSQIPASQYQLVGIVSSTGGLSAVETVLASLPQSFRTPIAVTQHLKAGDGEEYCRLLRQKLELDVTLVSGSVRPKAGTVYIAPPGVHLAVDRDGTLSLSEEPRAAAYKPSADVLLGSMARAFGPRCIGVVLTGMGDDGAEGLLKVKHAGGLTIAQDKETSRIFGMPAAAINHDAVQKVMPLESIGPMLYQATKRGLRT